MDNDASEIKHETEPSRVKDAVNERIETVRGAIGDAFGTVKDTVAGASGKIGDAAGTVREKLPTTDGVTDAARRGAGIAMENPLGLALGALAVGFLAGLAAPVSDLERKTVGPLRDGLVERARSAGTDAIEQGKQALQDKARAVLAAAQRSNGAS